jgi:iron complex transport system substrate-binding protein
MEKPAMLDRIRQMGVHVLVLPCEGWDDLMQAAPSICAALGDPVKGAAWVEAMQARKAALAERVSAHMAGQARPRVYVEVWRDPPTTVGPRTFLHELVSMAGGQNIGAVLKPGYVQINAEWVIRENPDAIVMAYRTYPKTRHVSDGQSLAPATQGRGAHRGGFEIAKRPGWSGIKAVRENRICADIAPELLVRPGPRMIEGAEAFADWLMRRDEQEITEMEGGRPLPPRSKNQR